MFISNNHAWFHVIIIARRIWENIQKSQDSMTIVNHFHEQLCFKNTEIQ